MNCREYLALAIIVFVVSSIIFGFINYASSHTNEPINQRAFKDLGEATNLSKEGFKTVHEVDELLKLEGNNFDKN